MKIGRAESLTIGFVGAALLWCGVTFVVSAWNSFDNKIKYESCMCVYAEKKGYCQ